MVCSGRGRDLPHIIIIILIIIIINYNYNNNNTLPLVNIITTILITIIIIIVFLSVSHSKSSPVKPCQTLSSRVSQPASQHLCQKVIVKSADFHRSAPWYFFPGAHSNKVPSKFDTAERGHLMS